MWAQFYTRNKIFCAATAFAFYCDAKHSDVLQGSVMFVVACF